MCGPVVFAPATSLTQVEAIWEFDNRLRAAAFGPLQHVETYLRALLGYHLGEVDPMIHRKPELLSMDRASDYPLWIAKLDRLVRDSREEFIVHHREKRNSIVPIWVAVDVLDWGGLSYLYSFAPLGVRDNVAQAFGLNAAQLKSWVRALNVVRNVCAHHSSADGGDVAARLVGQARAGARLSAMAASNDRHSNRWEQPATPPAR